LLSLYEKKGNITSKGGVLHKKKGKEKRKKVPEEVRL